MDMANPVTRTSHRSRQGVLSHQGLRKASSANPVITGLGGSAGIAEVFSDIADFRQSRGKRHPLSAILALACCAMLCGYRSYSAIAEWGRNYGTAIARALGFTPTTPCASTLHTIFRCIDREAFEAQVGAWAESVVATAPAAPEAPEIAM